MTTTKTNQAKHKSAVFVEQALRRDKIAPPETLYDSSTDPTLGVDTIPQSRYFSKEFHDLEVEKVWKKVWQMACWTQDIPNPGDISVYDIADISVMIVRQPDGSLKAFYNACLHRGRRLVSADCNAPMLYCPFHAWSWKLDGQMNNIPMAQDFEHVDKRTMGLPEVRLEEWNGFAFITLDDEAPSLEEYLEGLPEEWARWDYSKRFKAVHVVKHVPANWKTMLDAFIEAYHAQTTHWHLIATGAPYATQYDVWPERKHWSRAITLTGVHPSDAPAMETDQEIVDIFIKSYMPQIPLGSPETLVEPGGRARDVMIKLAAKAMGAQLNVDLSALSGPEVLDGLWYNVFPNFQPWPTLGFPLTYRFRPDGNNPDASLMDIMIILPFNGERPPSAKPVHIGPDESMEPVLGPIGKILDQDAALMRELQLGMKTLQSRGLVLGKYQESRIRHYHRTLSHYISK